MTDDSTIKQISLEEMMTLRAPSEAVSKWLNEELLDRLDTIRPLLSPRRLLGRHLRTASPEDEVNADKVFDQLKEAYRQAVGEPYRLRGKLESPLEPMLPEIIAHPWQYALQLGEGPKAKKITIKSPVSWVLMYPSPLSLERAEQMLSGEIPRDEQQLKQFVLSNLVMGIALEHSQGVERLLRSLRMDLARVTTPVTGKLSLVRLSFPVKTFRPSDNLILTATGLSGVSNFEELVDTETLSAMPDPFVARLQELGGANNG